MGILEILALIILICLVGYLTYTIYNLCVYSNYNLSHLLLKVFTLIDKIESIKPNNIIKGKYNTNTHTDYYTFNDFNITRALTKVSANGFRSVSCNRYTLQVIYKDTVVHLMTVHKATYSTTDLSTCDIYMHDNKVIHRALKHILSEMRVSYKKLLYDIIEKKSIY